MMLCANRGLSHVAVFAIAYVKVLHLSPIWSNTAMALSAYGRKLNPHRHLRGHFLGQGSSPVSRHDEQPQYNRP